MPASIAGPRAADDVGADPPVSSSSAVGTAQYGRRGSGHHDEKGIALAEQETAPAGWYPDTGGTQLRWWDGSAWTDHLAPTPSADPVPTVEFVADRRRVYSHDMLYVTDSAGKKVGRINLESGKVTMDLPELRSDFDEFVARWRAENIAASEADETPADDPGLSTATVEDQAATAVDPAILGEAEEEGTAWQDLFQNRTGQAVCMSCSSKEHAASTGDWASYAGARCGSGVPRSTMPSLCLRHPTTCATRSATWRSSSTRPTSHCSCSWRSRTTSSR